MDLLVASSLVAGLESVQEPANSYFLPDNMYAPSSFGMKKNNTKWMV